MKRGLSLGNGIAAIGGLAALIVGIVLRSHYEPLAHVCSSGVGVVSQAFVPAAQHQCSTDSGLAGFGLGLAIFGGCCLVAAFLSMQEVFAIGQHGKSRTGAPASRPYMERLRDSKSGPLPQTKTDSSTTTTKRQEPT